MTGMVNGGGRAHRRTRTLFSAALAVVTAFGLFSPTVAGAQSGSVDFQVTVAESGQACPGDLTRAPRGAGLKYCYEVANNTDAAIGAVNLADDNPVIGEAIAETLFGQGAGGSVRPGESVVFESARFTVDETGEYPGRATATFDGRELSASSNLTIHKPIVEVDGMLSHRASRTVVRPGTAVRFDYLLLNPTGSAVANPTVTDSACSPATFVAGDLNADRMLDPGERWTLTCSTVVSADTVSRVVSSATNTNDNTAISTSEITVSVAGPALTSEESAASVAELAEETAAQTSSQQEAEAEIVAGRAAAAERAANAAAGTPGTLPRTGPLDSSEDLVDLGLWLLIAGTGFTVLSWRRENATS